MRKREAKILLAVRVDPELKRELFDRAAALGISPSTFLRGMVEKNLKSDGSDSGQVSTNQPAITA